MKPFALFLLVVSILVLVAIILFGNAVSHRRVKLEVYRVGVCGENGMGAQLCDVLFTNGSMKRITRGPLPGDSVWVTIPIEEVP